MKTGKSGDREIDFVAEKLNNPIYLQVAYTLPDAKVKEKEFGNLLQLKDNYRKIVISLDEIQMESYQDIEHWHLRKFLPQNISFLTQNPGSFSLFHIFKFLS
ncbi:MAG: hypothetical protein ACOCZL_04610 [Bacteroidota bacterium]